MSDLAYQRYESPYRANKGVINARPNLSFTTFAGTGDEPAEVIPYPEGLVRSLRKRYAFRNEAAVIEFLNKRPFLFQVLLTAYKEIRRIFGTGPGLALKVVADPEAVEEQELFLYIQTRLHPRAARPLLDELSREWWLGAMLDANGEMNISLEYL